MYKDKYLKYKKKYLELQNQLGGMDSYTETEYMGGFRRMKGGAEVDCNECGRKGELSTYQRRNTKRKTVIDHLKYKFGDCKAECEDLKELNTKLVELNDLLKNEERITINDLKLAEFSASQLKSAGLLAEFSASQLKSAGFSAKELKDAGFLLANMGAFPPRDLKIAGFSAQEMTNAILLNEPIIDSLKILETLKILKNAGFSAKDLSKVTKPDETEKLYTLQNLIEAKYSIQELMGAGYSIQQLMDAGYSTKELKEAGFSAREFKDAGFSAKELKEAGFSEKVLKLINRIN